jgi:hypothetical protein
MKKPIREQIVENRDVSMPSLQKFNLQELEQFTYQKAFASDASMDYHLFEVGQDDVHSIIKHILSRVTVSLYMNTFGYDDDEVHMILMAKAYDPRIDMLITIDTSQSGGKHEKELLGSDLAKNPTAYNTYFVFSDSSTVQTSHTKGFVADGKVAGQGSTNWAGSGEGSFPFALSAMRTSFAAQRDGFVVLTNPEACRRFSAELVSEHMAARCMATPGMRSEQTVPVGSPAKTPGLQRAAKPAPVKRK